MAGLVPAFHFRHFRWSFRGACASTRTRNSETSIVPASGFRVRCWRAVPEWQAGGAWHLHCHGRACPGHLRLSFPHAEVVDARYKAGHDEEAGL